VVQKRLEKTTLINNKMIYLYILQNFENETRLTAGFGRFLHLFIKGDRDSTVVKGCATNRKVAGSIDIKFLQSHYGPGVDSASNRGKFPGGKGGRCVRLTTLPASCAVVMQSGSLNFLEPSGPLQACNGTALTFIKGTLAGMF